MDASVGQIVWLKTSYGPAPQIQTLFAIFLGTFSQDASKSPPGGLQTPKIMKKCKNTMAFQCSSGVFLHLLQHTFCPPLCIHNMRCGSVCSDLCLNCGLAGQVHGDSHCNYSRLELHLPRDAAHTAPANCLGGGVWGCGDDTPQASSIMQIQDYVTKSGLPGCPLRSVSS